MFSLIWIYSLLLTLSKCCQLCGTEFLSEFNFVDWWLFVFWVIVKDCLSFAWAWFIFQISRKLHLICFGLFMLLKTFSNHCWTSQFREKCPFVLPVWFFMLFCCVKLFYSVVMINLYLFSSQGLNMLKKTLKRKPWRMMRLN